MKSALIFGDYNGGNTPPHLHTCLYSGVLAVTPNSPREKRKLRANAPVLRTGESERADAPLSCRSRQHQAVAAVAAPATATLPTAAAITTAAGATAASTPAAATAAGVVGHCPPHCRCLAGRSCHSQAAVAGSS